MLHKAKTHPQTLNIAQNPAAFFNITFLLWDREVHKVHFIAVFPLLMLKPCVGCFELLLILELDVKKSTTISHVVIRSCTNK